MNELVISVRRGGKTRYLIEKCHADKYSLIVCPTRAMCYQVRDQAERMGKPIPMPITFDDFINARVHSRYIERFYFDELQASLQLHARGIPIETVVVDVTNTEIIDLEDAGDKS